MRDRFGEGSEKLQDIKNATNLDAFGDTSPIRGDKVKEPYKYHKEGVRQEGTSGGKVHGKKRYRTSESDDDGYPKNVGGEHKTHNTPSPITASISRLEQAANDLKKNLKF